MNYKKFFSTKANNEKRIKNICPNIPYKSGIYVFFRIDESGIKRAYCGQAVSLCERCASHLSEYDHIALSLKKYGFFSDKNPNGWNLIFELCEKEELDNKEIETIKSLADNGYQMYNVTAGGQSKGKLVTGIQKPAKGYHDGLKQGRKSLAKELSTIIEKHLEISLKQGKEHNKISLKQFEKFKELLKEENYD